MSELLNRLLKGIDRKQGRFNRLDAYWYGRQQLAHLPSEERKLLGDRMSRLVSNIPRLTVLTISERLSVQGFDGVDISHEWESNNMPQNLGVLFNETLLLGSGYVLVSVAPDGSPRITVESARQVSVERDPATREVTSAVKRWQTRTTTEATLFLPDRIVRFSAPTTGASASALRQVDEWPNPLGVVPVVPMINADRLLDTEGVSEIEDLTTLVDAANKLLVDMMCASEATGQPRRWATGYPLRERDKIDPATGQVVKDAHGNPVRELALPDNNRFSMAATTKEETKFGQWDAGEMTQFEAAMRIIMGHIGAVSTLPPAYLNMTNSQPTSADAVRAQESSLAARVGGKQLVFGPALERVAALTAAIRDGVPVESVTPRIRWGQPESRSIAQEADAATKLFQCGLLPASYALAKLGYSADEIAAIRAAKRAEALDGQGVNLTALPNRVPAAATQPVAA